MVTCDENLEYISLTTAFLFNSQTSMSACPRNSQPTIHITRMTAITMLTVQTQRDHFTARAMWDIRVTESYV